MRKIKLPSGADLSIDPASFALAKELYQALFEEAKVLKINAETDFNDVGFLKDVVCTALASKKVESALWACMKPVLYNKLHITSETFEPIEAREDYITVCFEVAKENVMPFLKSLYAQLGPQLASVKNSQA